MIYVLLKQVKKTNSFCIVKSKYLSEKFHCSMLWPFIQDLKLQFPSADHNIFRNI